MEENSVTIRKRILGFVLLVVSLFFICFVARSNEWLGNKQFHTILEIIATILALLAGVMILLKFYTFNHANDILLLACGFLGTAFFDGYHAIVTSTFFEKIWVNPPPHLIPWSWNASRTYLAIFVFLSWAVWHRDQKKEKAELFHERHVYFAVAAITIFTFWFFAFVPLPRAYYPEFIFGRPEEFVSALFFLLAVIGFFKKRLWAINTFEYYLMLSLLTGFIVQALVMPFSFKLFDFMFDLAHILKVVSYVFVLVGLHLDIFELYKNSAEMTNQLVIQNKALSQAKLDADKSRNEVVVMFEKVERSKEESDKKTAELEHFNSFLIDRELKMVSLKDEIRQLKEKLKNQEGSNE